MLEEVESVDAAPTYTWEVVQDLIHGVVGLVEDKGVLLDNAAVALGVSLFDVDLFGDCQ